MAELVDAQDLKSCEGNLVRVRFPPLAPLSKSFCSHPSGRGFYETPFLDSTHPSGFYPLSAVADGWNFPSETWGISFGNFKQFTGLRFNWLDEDVKQVNGWNVTLFAPPNKERGFEWEFNGFNIGGLWGPRR